MSQLQESTIVMVDDNADEIFLTRRLVRRDGLLNRFVSENNPERLFECLRELEASGVNKSGIIILLDINMPRQNGFETLALIRNSLEYYKTPVVMLSASMSEADKEMSVKLGANGYMVKPFSSDDLFIELKRVRGVKKKILSNSDDYSEQSDIYDRVPAAPADYPLKNQPS